jgi:cysteine desulfurase
MKNQDYLYLDHAASTPMRKSAMDKYIEAESFGYANSSGGHKLSRNSKNLLEDSREKIAELLNAAQGEIVFTSGGTEADNWTIKSLFNSKRPDDNLVTSNIEHEAVIASAEWVSSNGYQTKYAKSDKNGLVTKDEFLDQVDNDTKVASLMWGNNETGIIQPIKDIAREIKTINSSTLFHSDVVQGIISDNIDFHRNGIESAAISAHKIGGPKGVGAMFIHNKHKLPSFLHGGKQELERRAGTVDVPGIAAFATALEEQQTRFDEEVGLMKNERTIFEEKLKNSLNIEIVGDSMNRLPHISNVQFKNLNSEVLLIQLDLNGLGVSRGSACASGAQKPSHVLEAMNINPKFINSHLRFSFGWTTKAGDGSKAAEIVMKAIKEIE